MNNPFSKTAAAIFVWNSYFVIAHWPTNCAPFTQLNYLPCYNSFNTKCTCLLNPVLNHKKITCFLSVAYTMFHNVISRFLFGRTNFSFINHGRFGLSYVKLTPSITVEAFLTDTLVSGQFYYQTNLRSGDFFFPTTKKKKIAWSKVTIKQTLSPNLVFLKSR